MPLYREAYKLKSWEETVEKANQLNVAELETALAEGTGVVHLPCDLGEYTSPRYDIIQAHKVGDPVSKGLNGDNSSLNLDVFS